MLYINSGLFIFEVCSKFMDRVISVEYAVRDDDDKRNGFSPERRGRDMSPDRRSYDRVRSPSPYRRNRDSPDYGHGSNPSSRPEPRGSPKYERPESPVNGRYDRFKSFSDICFSQLLSVCSTLYDMLIDDTCIDNAAVHHHHHGKDPVPEQRQNRSSSQMVGRFAFSFAL